MTARFRLLGLLPLAFFLAHFYYHWRLGTPGDMLWMCHVSNVTLSIGLLVSWPVLIRIAVLWLIPGIPLWIFDMAKTGEWSATTFLSHIGGVIVGLVALAKVRADRRSWLYAVVWYLFIQQVCRMATPASLNVNIAYHMRDGWDKVFTAYWQYWLFTTVLVAVGLWILGIVLFKLFPPQDARS